MSNKDFWEEWNKSGGPKYPHEKLIQFLFRNYRSERDQLTALDLGSGGGVHTEFLLKEGLKVHAVDISENGISITRSKLENQGLKAESLLVASISDIDYPENHFDLVVTVSVLDSAGLEVSKKAISKAFRSLKPGGKLFAFFAHEEDYRREVLKDAGFHVFSESDVDSLLDQPWSELHRDIYMTTYNNKTYTQKDHVITATK